MITIIERRVGQGLTIKQIPNTLEALQSIVGGYIEIAYRIGHNELHVICNEEGIMLGLPPNACGLLGNFLIAKSDANGEMISLTKEDEQIALSWYRDNKDKKHPSVL